ncbi:hypothetical protein EVAR_22574_1 [Eumeta japonica]|uniref:Uncharacterized protein n=1 Tax=Eumeta variegata TaxID=151549 RepID=A0A4C1U7L8_EUMVA|nr:hypothetical protein EVAR_22574_1 [Eumeta japonica]
MVKNKVVVEGWRCRVRIYSLEVRTGLAGVALDEPDVGGGAEARPGPGAGAGAGAVAGPGAGADARAGVAAAVSGADTTQPGAGADCASAAACVTPNYVLITSYVPRASMHYSRMLAHYIYTIAQL